MLDGKKLFEEFRAQYENKCFYGNYGLYLRFTNFQYHEETESVFLSKEFISSSIFDEEGRAGTYNIDKATRQYNVENVMNHFNDVFKRNDVSQISSEEYEAAALALIRNQPTKRND